MMTEAVRVLHVFHGMDCGGAENMIMNLFRCIDRSKVCFDFLVHTEKHCYFDDEITKLGGKVYHVPYFNGLNYVTYKKELDAFFADHHDYVAVHGHLGSCVNIYLKAAKKYGIYAIAHCHNSKPSEVSLKNIAYKYACIRTRSVADYFFTCSKIGSIYRYGKKIASSDKCKMINNAIDTGKYIVDDEQRKQIREKLGIRESQKVLGNVARFVKEKNQVFLIDVFAEVLKIDSSSVLLLVGDGPLRKDIEEKVQSMGIASQVIMTGVRSDVPDLLAAMDVFVMPSLFEGLPVTIVEAQASGLKCIISDGVPDDCMLTNDVVRIPLSENAEQWAKQIVETWSYSRTANTETLKEKGFDVETTSKWLANYYLHCKK